VSRDRRHQHRGRLLIAASLAVLSLACGTSDSSSGPSSGAGGTDFDRGDAGFEDVGGTNGAAGAGGDRGAPPASAASPEAFVNNPIDQLFADPQRSPWDLLSVDSADAQGYVDAALGCYANPAACDTTGCRAFASCCVASGSCCATVVDTSLPDSLDFRECAGLTIGSCLANEGLSAGVFGEQEPVLTGRGLVPNGSATAEGGALLGGVVDLASHRVLVEVQFSLAVGCGGSCLQSAGVAFTPQQLGGFAGAEVGLLLSSSREVVNLMIAGQVADSFDAGNDDTVWRLTLSPSGVARVERDGATLGSYPFDSQSLRQARLAIFGRNLVADENSAAVAYIATQTAACDNPRGWSERMPVTVTVQGNVDPQLMMGLEPSIAAGPEITAVAFERDGEIFVGQEDAFGLVNLETPGSIASISPSEEFEAGGVGDPELFWLLESLHVVYTAYDANGVGSIGFAVITDDVAEKEQAPILSPMDDVISYESPTLLVRDDLLVMMVRATLSSGATELRAFYSVDPGAGWARIVDGTLEELTRVDDPASEITSPSLIVHNSAYQLYYARRTGTRWAVELATSDELLLWRPLGEAIGASGEGFDSLGARGPDAQSLNDRIEMIYMGQDGVSFELGIASRSAPSNTALQ